MPSYLVEAYAAPSPDAVADARERARGVATLDPRVRYVRTTFVPGDETIMHLFEAPSTEVLDRASRLAELPFERIVEAVEQTDAEGALS